MKQIISAVLGLALFLSGAIPSGAAETAAFTDVPANAYYAEAANYCRKNDLVSGTAEGVFSPNLTLSRGMLATILWRSAGRPEAALGGDTGHETSRFSDVKPGSYYEKAVGWAASTGIVAGYGENSLGGSRYGPGDPVQRQQAAAMLYRYAQYRKEDLPAAGIAAFADSASIAGYAQTAAAWAREKGIITGKDGNRFDPTGRTTRAEAATMVYRFLTRDSGDVPQEPGSSSKALVAYFSCTGHTKTVAGQIANALGADATLYEIVPAQAYTEADLNYHDPSSRSQREQNDPAARPAMSGAMEQLERYDVIYLGYPIWNGQAPRILSTFLESADFSGKTIVPFCTSGSSGIGSSAEALRSVVKGAQINWLSGRRFAGDASESDAADWAREKLEEAAASSGQENQGEEPVVEKLQIQANGHTFTAVLEDNSSAEALKDLLAEGPLTVPMEDYGNFEKVGPLGTTLPRNDTQITTGPGDVILYQGDKITIYYDVNSWSFTRLAKIENTTGEALKEALGSGGVTVTFSLVSQ